MEFRHLATSFQRVGVVVGLAAEARIARRLGWRVRIGGGTAAGAGVAAQRLIDDGCDSLVSFGLAGGLDPRLRPGAPIVPSAVLVNGTAYPTDRGMSQLLGGTMNWVMLGADAIVASIEAKRQLRHCTSAAAVDTESGAVAIAASARCMPFAVLRAVCDPADRALPAVALAALDGSGSIDIRRVGASVIAEPGQLPALLVLASDAAAARRCLTRRVRQITGARA